MLLKLLAIGGAGAMALIVVALTLSPVALTGAAVGDPAEITTVMMPNGVAMPQLQPNQPASAPALVNDVSLTAPRLFSASKLDTKAAANQATQQQLYMGCGGE